MTDTHVTAERLPARLVVVPAMVGAVDFGAGMAVYNSFTGPDAACVERGGLECTAEAVFYGLGGLVVAAVLTWLLLAFVVGAWRAPVITYAGAVMGAYGLRLVSGYLLDGRVAAPWAAALVGAAAFGAVGAVCLPRLSRPVRVVAVVGLVAVAAWAFGVGPVLR